MNWPCKTLVAAAVASLFSGALIAQEATQGVKEGNQSAQEVNQNAKDDAASPSEKSLPKVIVVETTPIPGVGQAKEEVPANVQTATESDIKESQSLNLADFLNKNLTGVHINDVQGNPYQVDVNFRGYTASPLLGTPQGLSIYMDGVQLNQPFGDVVSWDLIPKSAIKSITLIPGSNPLFGLNTLGGALSIQTKDGRSFQGSSAETTLGMNNRVSAEFERGGIAESGVHYYFLANRTHDGGWRDSQRSDVSQFFSKVGGKFGSNDVKLSYALADTTLLGGGLQQAELLNARYSSVFTKPDITKNTSNFLNLELSRELTDKVLLTSNAYYRNIRGTTSNADINEESFNQGIYTFGESGVARYTAAQVATLAALTSVYGGPYSRTTANTNSRYSSTGYFPSAACISNANSGTEPNEKCNAILNTTETTQTNFGLTSQFTITDDLSFGKNILTLGGGFDKSRVHFTQGAQFGYLNSDRSMTTVNAYADGMQQSEGAFNQKVDLNSGSTTWSLFSADTLSIEEKVHLTAAARCNRTSINNVDHLDYTASNANMTTYGSTNLRNSLTESHVYQRVNPAIGVSYTPNRLFNPYASYSESSRAPTSIELGCADPDFGCRLPNSMAGDPYLKQVISRTIEAGFRGMSENGFVWAANVFRAMNSNDILFVANTSSTGYFKNFEKFAARDSSSKLGVITVP